MALGAGALAVTAPIAVISGTAQAGTRVTMMLPGTRVTPTPVLAGNASAAYTAPVTQHPATDPAILTGTFASMASAATGDLEIITGHGLVQNINDPSGCIGPPVGGYWGPETKIVNDTDHAVYLYTGPGCYGPSTSLPSRESTTGDYSRVLAP